MSALSILPDTAPAQNLAATVLSDLGRMGIDPVPAAFAVWHMHLSGSNQDLSALIRQHLEARTAITGQWLEDLYERHVTNSRAHALAERSSRSVLFEIDGIMELIRLSLGSTNKYSTTLSRLLGDMVTANDPATLRQIVSTLVSATEETRGLNMNLETRLRAASSEIDELRKVLADTRIEALKDSLTGVSNRKHFDQSIDEGGRYEKGLVWFEPLPHFRPSGFGIGTHLDDPAVQPALWHSPAMGPWSPHLPPHHSKQG